MKKNLVNIIFYILIMVLLLCTVVINKDYNVIFNKKIINDEKDINKYEDYKFITLNTSDLEETRFSLSDNDNKTIIYVDNIGDKSFLLELTDSTVNTGTLDLMYMKDNANIDMLKNNISEESELDLDFQKGYYTNKDYEKNKNIISIKFYITIGLGVLCFIFIILNIINLFVSKKEDF